MVNKEKISVGSDTSGLHPLIIYKKDKSHIENAVDSLTRFP